jgi:hypothetical protein
MAAPALLLLLAATATLASAGLSTYGFAAKNVAISSSSSETTLWSISLPAGSPSAALTLMHVESADFLWSNYDFMRLRVYVDGEISSLRPGVDFRLGCVDEGDTVPFGTSLIGNTAEEGGVYLTIKVPFTTALVITATLAPFDSGTHHVNVQFKAVAGVPFSFAGVTPPEGTFPRLRTSSIDGETFEPLAAVPLANSSAPGVLALVGMKVAGATNMSFLSGGVTAQMDGASSPVPLGFDLPSFFLEDDGQATNTYTTPIAGITALAPLLGHSMIAWRSFQEDPVVWSSSLSLAWSIGDIDAPPASPTTVYSSVFWYEFVAE